MTTAPAERPPVPDSLLWRVALAAAGWALSALGALVLVAWAGGEPGYVQLDPERPPLHYNGGLAFLVWGGAYLSMAWGRPRPARALGWVLAAAGGAFLWAAVPGAGLRLDRWAFDPAPHGGGFSAAGVVPAMGLACALGAAAVLLTAGAGRGPLRSLLGTLIGGFLAFSGPVLLLTAAPGPAGAGPTGATVLGAAGTVAAGLALLPTVFRAGAPRLLRVHALPLAVGFTGIGLTLALWAALTAEHDRRVYRQVQFEVAHAQHLLVERLPHEVGRVAEVAERWPDLPPGAPPNQLELDAGLYVGMTPGCLGVARIDAGLGVTWVVSGAGAPGPGADLGGGPVLAEAARTGKVAVVRPPRSAWRGQQVLLIFAPHRPKSPGGGLLSAISMQQFYGTMLNANVAPGYAVTVSEGGEPVFARDWAAPDDHTGWAQSLPVSFHGHEWRLSVRPTRDALARENLSLPRLSLVIGLLMTALLAVAVQLAQTARSRAFALENEMRERRLAEQALRQGEEKYRTLIENLEQGVFLQNAEHRYVAANVPFCKSVGRPEAEVIGATEGDLFDPDRAARQADEVRAVLADGRSAGSETEVLAGGRRTWVRRVLTPVRDAAGRVTGVLGICWDVTEQRELEAHVHQASKMDAIGQLAGGIAHDFNNLLTVILGNLEMMLAGLPADHPDRPLGAAAQSAAQRAAALTQRLLGFARRHQLDWRPTNLNGVVAEVVGLLQRTIDPLTRIETDLDPDLWLVDADPTQLNQVLMNLCINARDAIAGPGVIAIATARVTGAEVVGPGGVCRASDRYVRLRVGDTGAGMPPEVKARIYEPFFTTKDVGKGTGLGLAMVFAIVRQHKGWIDCTSEVGGGTRFDVFFPRGGGPRAAGPPPTPVPVRRTGQGTVLVVDDEEMIRTLSGAALRAAGYDVLTAGDGQQAVDLYAKDPGRIDLVVLDLTMPVMSGHEAFRRLVDLNPGVKILLVSGYSAEQLSELEKEKMIGFVKKPFRPSELIAVVDGALPGRSGFRPTAPRPVPVGEPEPQRV